MTTIWQHDTHISKDAGKHYIHHSFDVPEGVKQLHFTLNFHKKGSTQLYASLFSPSGYRGTRMKPGATGDVVLELAMSEHTASPGALRGEIVAGAWGVLLDVQWIDEDIDYSITVETSKVESSAPTFQASESNGREGAGYYRGELHAHTFHSDGNSSVCKTIAAAKKYGLDYFSLTDHFTSAGWEELESLASEDLAVLKGIEFTGQWGHGNLQGLKTWVDTFIDDGKRTINDVIDETHAQGGLFSVNHAFSLNLGWRYHELDWTKVDLFEIYHHLTGSNNTAQLGLWDSLLMRGLKTVGVGAIDSHDPHSGQHRLGQVFTYVYADALGPEAIVRGLKTGNAYVSLGPTLLFNATSHHDNAKMGEDLAIDGTLHLNIQLDNLNYPTQLLVMKNGLHHSNIHVPAGKPFELELKDDKPGKGYYRLELYAKTRDGSFEAVREWDKTLLLSNPIFTV
jgi:hypothetical protein